MKVSTSLLLSAFLGAASASAVSDAPVYIIQADEWTTTPNSHTLTTDQARLVFSQRLGTSQRHSLESADADTLRYINQFGGHQDSLFQVPAQDKAPELLLVIGGVSPEIAGPLFKPWESITPAFTISAPSSFNGEEFVLDGREPRIATPSEACVLKDAVNPFDGRCWSGEKGKSIYFELDCENRASRIAEVMAVQERIIRFAKNGEMNIAVVLMPKSSKLPKCRSPRHGSQAHLGRREQAEEPITELPESSSAPPSYSKQLKTSITSFDDEPITGVPPLCHPSLDSCISSTNNCSGHGECYKKYGSADDTDASPGCFTCGCIAQSETFSLENGKKGFRITYWGGAACQKKDVSGPFWLIAIFSVVMVGLVSWSIGLLFSIGEEKLPGVIGAGVSSKTR